LLLRWHQGAGEARKEAAVLMSLCEYARYRGCDKKAVQFAVERGRITRNPDGTIDSDAADQEWEQNTDHAHARYGPKPPSRTRTSHRETHGDRPRATVANVDERPGVNFHNARAAREIYEARLKKLLYEQRLGNLLPRAEVEAATQNTFQIFREAMLNVPNRVAGQLAAEGDPRKIHELLETEIQLALWTFVEVGGSIDVSAV
jgi:hypothetical protein